MYWVLKKNGCTIPEYGLNMIRFHSFYPWHDKRAYAHLECPEDLETLNWVKEFNKFDLYKRRCPARRRGPQAILRVPAREIQRGRENQILRAPTAAFSAAFSAAAAHRYVI